MTSMTTQRTGLYTTALAAGCRPSARADRGTAGRTTAPARPTPPGPGDARAVYYGESRESDH